MRSARQKRGGGYLPTAIAVKEADKYEQKLYAVLQG
jgi:hypothetical protein